jgi:aryl-alcohol dehydrogenase
MRTKVALKNGPHEEFAFAEVDLDGPRQDEVLVRIVATGLCHTDLTVPTLLSKELFPNVFGHEGAGVVEAVGSDIDGIEVGDHVVMSLRSCRTCKQCKAGRYCYCELSLLLNYMGTRLDGSTVYSLDEKPVFGSFFGQSSFSQHAISYADNTVVVDPLLDLRQVAPYGCGFQTGAGAVLNVLRTRKKDSLVVYGAGAVGLAAIAAAAGAEVETIVAVDLLPGRLALAEWHGAVGINPAALGEVSLVDAVKEMTDGGASCAIDTTAVPSVLNQAAQSLAVRGELVVLGLGAPEFPVDAIDLMQNGKSIRGSVEGDSDPLTMVPRLLQLNADGKFDVNHLAVPYAFEDINQAVADSSSGGAVKPVLVW